MRRISTALLLALGAASGLAGCGAIGTRPAPPRPAYYVAPPAPGTRRCVVWREDMYGRRFCDRYVGS